MATELILLGTAGAPLPVAGRAGISSALVVDGRVLHADHTADLPGMLLYGWGVRTGEDGGPLPPIRVYGPSRPDLLPAGQGEFDRQTTIFPAVPASGTADLVEHILAGYAYHLNVMPLDARMPDAGALVRGTEIPRLPAVVFDDGIVKVSAVAVTHGHAVPALAYRFDTPDGSVAFSGDTTVNENLIALADGTDILVHQVIDLDYLERHGAGQGELALMAALLTDVSQVGAVAERARAGFGGTTTAGRDGLRRVLAGRVNR